jgi:hypothetical protein
VTYADGFSPLPLDGGADDATGTDAAAVVEAPR